MSELDLFAADAHGAEPSRPARATRAAPPAPPAAPDAYPGETAQSAVAVSTLTETARDVVEGAFIPLWVRGEVTDFK